MKRNPYLHYATPNPTTSTSPITLCGQLLNQPAEAPTLTAYLQALTAPICPRCAALAALEEQAVNAGV